MRVRFGICADLHSDYIHDSYERFSEFIDASVASKCDFMISLGDSITPGESNQEDKDKMRSAIASSVIPIYYALGNHDMDENRKCDVLDYLDIPRSYYSFDCGGVHFVVLDTCYFLSSDRYENYELGNYKRAENKNIAVLPDEVLSWLAKDLASADYPSVIFSHHSLIESRTGIGNTEALRSVINNASRGVILCACGHEHVDRLEEYLGVYYWCVNSMSYYWAGSKYSHDTYGDDIELHHPNLRNVFPYRDSLFAIVEIADDIITIKGQDSEIVGNSPESMDFKKVGLLDPITASIRSRVLKI